MTTDKVSITREGGAHRFRWKLMKASARWVSRGIDEDEKRLGMSHFNHTNAVIFLADACNMNILGGGDRLRVKMNPRPILGYETETENFLFKKPLQMNLR